MTRQLKRFVQMVALDDEIRVERAEVEPIGFPLKPPLATARGVVAMRAAFILRLFARDGLVGVGEAAPAYWLGGETLGETRAAMQKITARLSAHPATVSELRRWAGLDEPAALKVDDLAGNEADRNAARPGASALAARRRAPLAAKALLSPAALCALDCATLELCARGARASVAQLLARQVGAGKPGQPVAVSVLLSAESTRALAAQARAGARLGFRTFKLKIGAGANDLERVMAVAEAAGAGAALRLDANRAYGFERAAAALSALARAAPIEFIEEPLRRPSPAAYKRLRALTGARIALDESFSDEASLEPYLDADAADVIVLKLARLGGPSRCVRLAVRLARAGLAPCVTDSIESAVGMAAAVHLAAALPHPRFAAGLGGARLLPPQALARFPRFSPALCAVRPGFALRAARRSVAHSA